MNTYGPDYSHWDGPVAWTKPKIMGAGFAFAKCTDGVNFFDSQYLANYAGALEQGILFDGYHWWRLDLDPFAQAAWFAAHLRPGTLAPVADVEETRYGFPADRCNRLKQFLQAVEAYTGKTPIIYTAAWYWDQYFTAANEWAWRYPLWDAHYKNFSGPAVPGAWPPTNWDFWQHRSNGVGKYWGTTSANVDLNVANYSLLELKHRYEVPEPGPTPAVFPALVGKGRSDVWAESRGAIEKNLRKNFRQNWRKLLVRAPKASGFAGR